MKNKINELMIGLGQLAISIKQSEDKIKEHKENYKTLSDQIILLQTLEQKGHDLVAPTTSAIPQEQIK